MVKTSRRDRKYSIILHILQRVSHLLQLYCNSIAMSKINGLVWQHLFISRHKQMIWLMWQAATDVIQSKTHDNTGTMMPGQKSSRLVDIFRFTFVCFLFARLVISFRNCSNHRYYVAQLRPLWRVEWWLHKALRRNFGSRERRLRFTAARGGNGIVDRTRF